MKNIGDFSQKWSKLKTDIFLLCALLILFDEDLHFIDPKTIWLLGNFPKPIGWRYSNDNVTLANVVAIKGSLIA